MKNGLDPAQAAETIKNSLHHWPDIHIPLQQNPKKGEKVQIKMILRINIGLITDVGAFTSEVMSDLAFAVLVNPANLEIISFLSEQTGITLFVNIFSYPGDSDNCDSWKSAPELAIQLEDQAKNPFSRLFLGKHTSKISSLSIVPSSCSDCGWKPAVSNFRPETTSNSFLPYRSPSCFEDDPNTSEQQNISENKGVGVTNALKSDASPWTKLPEMKMSSSETRKYNAEPKGLFEKIFYRTGDLPDSEQQDFAAAAADSKQHFVPNNLPLIACVSVQDLSNLNQKLQKMTECEAEQIQNSSGERFAFSSETPGEILKNNIPAIIPMNCTDKSKYVCEFSDNVDVLENRSKLQDAVKIKGQGSKLNASSMVQVPKFNQGLS